MQSDMPWKNTQIEEVINVQYDKGKNQTRILEQNIHNLVYAHYTGIGDYDIPEMHPVQIIPY